ncbi:MAG TPA: dephospho-CoA kinase [Rhizomicrobium sp.]|nr:dephospho-CoA kinase [Rhizomicrobium sp.]
MAERLFLVGLTGSIGMGKSETAKMFARLGIPVYDSDAAVHRLYEKGGAAVPEIEKAFPGTTEDGHVDRALLSKRLAAEPDGFRRLEAIVHPLVAREQAGFREQALKDGARMIVLDVPLLFETGGHARMDAVVVVSAPRHIQRERVLARPGMSADKLDQILARQMPDAEKRAKAHFVVETGKGLDHAFAQVKAIVAELNQRIAARDI